MVSSTGLSTRTGMALAYSGWWLTGGVMWFIERRDPTVRFHAAQSTITFGGIAIFIILCGMFAVASLSFLPMLFSVFAALGGAALIGGVVLWAIVMWKVMSGDEWRIPIAAEWAGRFATPAIAAASS